MKYEIYQGWYNKQTWCVVNTFNNEKILQDQALQCVRDNLGDNSKIERALKMLAARNVEKVWNFADWCWTDGEGLAGDVNWQEVREHYEMKISEERRFEVTNAID